MHYVLSDIHGDQAAFDRILDMIGLSDADQLYILGDVVDRGPDGIALLEKIRKIGNCTLLLGNHEMMMINALRHPENMRYQGIWMNNGCDDTRRAYTELPLEEQEDLLQYLEGLPIQKEFTVANERYLLVHAAPMELFDRLNWKYDDQKEFAVWYRLRYETNLTEGITIIHGHTPTKMIRAQHWPTMRIFRFEDVINIDCGCGYPELGGQLGCIRLEDGTEYYSKEGIVSAQESAKWNEEMKRAWENEWRISD